MLDSDRTSTVLTCSIFQNIQLTFELNELQLICKAFLTSKLMRAVKVRTKNCGNSPATFS